VSDRRTILIVDDVALFRELGSLFLARTGRILTAASGEEGLAIVRRVRPDLVLTDFQMPGMSGESLCRAIKDDPELSDTPVVVMLGRHSGKQRARAVRAGADATLEKPLDRLSLVETVNRFVRFDVARGLPRVDLSTPVAIEAGDRRLYGTLRNLSRGGVFLETAGGISESMEVGLRFCLPDSDDVLSPSAQVVWSSTTIEGSETCGIGLQFVELDRSTSRSLDDYVLERTPLRMPMTP